MAVSAVDRTSSHPGHRAAVAGAVPARPAPHDRARDDPLCAPAWLPAGVHVTGGNAPGGDDAVMTFARNPRGSGGGFIQQMRGRRQGGYVAPADRAEVVRVHGQPAT